MNATPTKTKRSATTRVQHRTTAEKRGCEKVTKARVEQFYAALGLAGLKNLPATSASKNGVNCVLTANSGV